MSLDYRFQSLEESFPRELTPEIKRDFSPFGKSWTQVQQLLERELRFLSYRVGSVILQTAHSPYEVRRDGKLRADVRKPVHPGVVLKFDVYNSQAKRYEQMSFECDQFTEWKANVRAIADALEALRKVNRYGVSGGGKSNAHYEGYKALPGQETVDTEQAATLLMIHSAYSTHSILGDQKIFKDAYRQASIVLHPDKPTGSHEKFVQLQKAKEILEKYFNK